MLAENQNTKKSRPLLSPDERKSFGDAATCSLMVGLGETYLPAFGLTFGLGQIGAGLLASLPQLTGGVLQLLAPRFAHRMGSYKNWVLTCAGAQTAVFVLLALAASGDHVPSYLLFSMAAIYWGAGFSAAPTWNNWIEKVIPAGRLTDFLATRSRIIQVAAFLAFLAGGLWLQEAQKSGDIRVGYQALFLAAALSRLTSMALLARQREEKGPRNPKGVRAKVREAMRTFGRRDESRFLLYLLGTQVMVQISGPYFTPFMLGYLKFSYSTYAILISANYAARIIAYPWVSRIVHRYGTDKSLRLGGFLIAASPLTWSLTTDVFLLGLGQVFAGFAWALYELATTLIIFEKVPAEKRTSILSCYNFLNALAIVGGALIGGLVLNVAPAELSYKLLFILSGAGRLSTLVFLTVIGSKLRKAKKPSFSPPLTLNEAPPASLTPEPIPRAQAG